MSDEMKVQTKGLNKKFIFIAIALIAVGLVAALVLVPTYAKAKKVEEQLNLGAKYLSELDYEQAIAAYEAVIKIDPKCEEAYLALADVYIATGEFDKAEEVLKRAEEAISEDAPFLEEKRQEVLEGQKQAESTPVPSPTAIPTPTNTPSPTPTNTPSPTSTNTPSPAPTNTPSPTPTNTPSPTPTNTPSPTPTSTSITEVIESDVKDFEYIEEEKGITIIEYCGSYAERSVFIPRIIDEKPVVKIESRAFLGKGLLESIILPDTVTEIGEDAFRNCSSIKSFEIPENVVSIGSRAFWGCSGLEEIIIPGSVEEIPSQAFYQCSNLSKINISNGVKKISSQAFRGCSEIQYLEMPDSIVEISYQAFGGCINLKEVVFSKNLEIISSRAFSGCSSIERVDIPLDVSRIEEFTFYDCVKLVEVNLHDGIEYIGDEAFENCESLKDVCLGKNVRQIGVAVFSGCSELESIKVDPENKIYTSRDSDGNECNVVYMMEEKRIIAGCKNSIISDGIKVIGAYAFSGTAVSTVSLPDSVTDIEDYAFSGCSQLTVINSINGASLPKSISKLGEGAFFRCEALVIEEIEMGGIKFESSVFCGVTIKTLIVNGKISVPNPVYGTGALSKALVEKVVISDDIEVLSGGLFRDCESIKEVTIPSSVKEIKSRAFEDCSALSTLKIPSSVYNIATGAFSGCEELIIYTPAGSYAEQWAKENGVSVVVQ